MFLFIVMDCTFLLCRRGVTDVQAEGAAVHASRSGTKHAWCLCGRIECSVDAGDQVGLELHSKEPQEHSGMRTTIVLFITMIIVKWLVSLVIWWLKLIESAFRVTDLALVHLLHFAGRYLPLNRRQGCIVSNTHCQCESRSTEIVARGRLCGADKQELK